MAKLMQRLRGTKTCSQCGKELPATDEHFKIDKRQPDGLDPRCRRCFDKYNKESNPRRLTFKGQSILQKSKPRTGVCRICHRSVAKGKIKTTSMHHYGYDPEYPERWTFEVCNRDHRRIHALARRLHISLLRATIQILWDSKSNYTLDLKCQYLPTGDSIR